MRKRKTKLSKNKMPADFQSQKISSRSIDPSITAAAIIEDFNSARFGPEVTLNGLIKDLDRQIAAINKGDMNRPEAILVSQAHTLDVLFSFLSAASYRNFGKHMDATERYMRLALKAQSQCQATIRTLGELKNPKQLAFIKQANLAGGHQQINNGGSQQPDKASRGKSKNPQNELLEQQHGERLDAGAQRAPETSDTAMETVEAVNRPTDGRGQGEGG